MRPTDLEALRLLTEILLMERDLRADEKQLFDRLLSEAKEGDLRMALSREKIRTMIAPDKYLDPKDELADRADGDGATELQKKFRRTKLRAMARTIAPKTAKMRKAVRGIL